MLRFKYSLYGTTTYTAALNGIIATFNISPRLAILGFTMPFFGVFFAPIVTPHLSEKYGRRTIYLTSMPLFALFVVTGGLASNFPTVLATRFFAGFFGGPCLVLIEGTFADVWSAEKTVTYYSFLTLASFWGAGIGETASRSNFVKSWSDLIESSRSCGWRLCLCFKRPPVAELGDAVDRSL